MKYLNRPFLLLGILTIVSCSENASKNSLEGCWVREDSKSIECWEKQGDVLVGKGMQVTGHGDTVVFEHLQFFERNTERVYAARVGQDSNFVEFIETEPWVFENSNHDFPKRIQYTFHSSHQMDVRVGEGEAAFTWKFTKK